jgi:nitroimidazol reductase NimA-like FMN-containing flavoprotein (pyridoxamine 5'-phosphate oxidase superfamily)
MTPTSPTNTELNTAAQTTGPKGSEMADRPRGQRVGDLARRVTQRRTELGLSTEELAKRAGMDPWYLAYFEQSSDDSLPSSALSRLAVALDTTPIALEGGQAERPPGVGRAGPHPSLESLTSEQCEVHLAGGGVGRIILSTGSGPVAFPVNFVFADGAVIFRTSDAMTANVSGIVAFEVDHIDEAMSGGWSVLVRGHAGPIEDPDERRAAADLDIEPWAGGKRPNLVRVAPFEMTGRVIVQRQPEAGLTDEQHYPPVHIERERRTS